MMRRNTTAAEKKIYREVLIQHLRKLAKLPQDPQDAEIVAAYNSISLKKRREALTGVRGALQERTYDWCYQHFKKVYTRAEHGARLGGEQKREIARTVYARAGLGEELGQIRFGVQGQEQFQDVFEDDLYAVVHKAWRAAEEARRCTESVYSRIDCSKLSISE